MCGIAGGVNIDVRPALVHQVKRGPDHLGMDVWPDHNTMIAHNRLSILDLSQNGNQPMSSGRYTLTYNGEIYNYREMQSYLYASDDLGNCPGGNDAKTLLLYIEKFCLSEAFRIANGMYAFCCFDAELQQIHLVVDRFGQKPLYYCHDGASFAFASSVGALMQLRDKWKIDEEGLQSYWLLGSTMGENSMISGIKRLTGSHHLTYDIRANSIEIERYWTPKYIENTSGIEDLVLDAINKVKVSDVPVYTFLSGGIDSTLVASQMRGMNAVHLDSPEYFYAHQVAEKFGMNLVKVNPLNIDVEAALKDYAFQSGEPSMAALIPYITSKEVNKLGAKVAISANGADELFFGYDRTKERVIDCDKGHLFRSLPNEYQPFRECFWGFSFDERISEGRMFELQTYVQFDLNKTLDAASMCHSLEVRCPFLDHRLVEMALSIPEEVHRKQGNKTILKNMLRKMGFDDKFLNRPKLGFSLHQEPEGLDLLKIQAWQFVKQNGFLKCDDRTLTPRDKKYLEMSALSFWMWYQVWEHKL